MSFQIGEAWRDSGAWQWVSLLAVDRLAKDPVGPKAGHSHLGNVFLSIGFGAKSYIVTLAWQAGKWCTAQPCLLDTQQTSCILVYFPEVGRGRTISYLILSHQLLVFKVSCWEMSV